MGRRRFIRNLAKLGVSGVGLQFMTKEALAETTDDPENEVPRLSHLRHKNHDEVVAGTAAPEYEPIYYTISREKWAIVETAHDAAEKIDRRLSNVDNTGLLSAGVRTTTNNHHREKAIHVRYHIHTNQEGEVIRKPNASYEEVKEELPSTVAGTAGEGEHKETIEDIPVQLSRSEFQNVGHNDSSGGASGDFYYDYKYRPLPGGCMNVNKDKDELGTVATPAYDNESDEYVLTTAAHLTDADEGDQITQPCCDYSVGESDKGAFSYWDFDAATIDVNTDKYGNHDVEYAFAEDDGYSISEIWGVLAWDTIKDNEGNSSYNMQWRGAVSGHEGDTHIVETNTDHYFWLNEPVSPGDSGGPMYHTKFYGDDGRIYIAGIIGQNDDGDDDGDSDTAGTWMGDVTDKFNLYI